MTNLYIAAAWIITFAIVGGYALSLVVRGRRLSASVPAENRRWMKAPTEDGLYGAIAADPVADSAVVAKGEGGYV